MKHTIKVLFVEQLTHGKHKSNLELIDIFNIKSLKNV